jgi:hypothetical protein
VKYQRLGRASGRDVYLFTYEDPGTGDDAPGDYSIAAVVLQPEWKPEDLGWTLNALYGALAEWDEFAPNSGARSFAFYGERADVASNLCDTFAYAWTSGDDDEYDNIIATSHDETALDAFVENVFTGEIFAGNEFADSLTNIVFAVQTLEQAQALTPILSAAVERHQAD